MLRYRVYIDTHSQHTPLTEWVKDRKGAMKFLQDAALSGLYQGKLSVWSAEFMRRGAEYIQLTKEKQEFALFSMDERRKV